MKKKTEDICVRQIFFAVKPGKAERCTIFDAFAQLTAGCKGQKFTSLWQSAIYEEEEFGQTCQPT